MDFSNHPTASIDFSPTHQARNITLVLEEKELADASWGQMERFLRVWCVESKEYAPNLVALTIALRPSVNENNNITMLGIKRFLDHFQNIRCYLPTRIYLDSWSDLRGNVRRKYADTPTLIV